MVKPVSESNPPKQSAEPNRKQPARVNGKIICPVCRSEILEGEPVCWVCYGGQTVTTKDSGTSDGSKIAYIFGSIFAGLAISLGSILIGIVIAVVTLLAAIDSFFDSLGCTGALLTYGLIGWAFIDWSLIALGRLF